MACRQTENAACFAAETQDVGCCCLRQIGSMGRTGIEPVHEAPCALPDLCCDVALMPLGRRAALRLRRPFVMSYLQLTMRSTKRVARRFSLDGVDLQSVHREGERERGREGEREGGGERDR